MREREKKKKKRFFKYKENEIENFIAVYKHTIHIWSNDYVGDNDYDLSKRKKKGKEKERERVRERECNNFPHSHVCAKLYLNPLPSHVLFLLRFFFNFEPVVSY